MNTRSPPAVIDKHKRKHHKRPKHSNTTNTQGAVTMATKLEDYLAAYEVALSATPPDASREQRKMMATEQAKQLVPGMREIMQTVGRSMRSKGSDEAKSPDYKTGREAIAGMRRINFQFFVVQGNGKPKQTPAAQAQTITPASIVSFGPAASNKKQDAKNAEQLYREWCSANKFVASDNNLAHFTGLTPSAYSRVRAVLVKQGWQFARVPHGDGVWQVIQHGQGAHSSTQKQNKHARTNGAHAPASAAPGPASAVPVQLSASDRAVIEAMRSANPSK